MAVATKKAQLEAPHIAPLTAFARAIAQERGADVPWFDPASGGVSSRVLLLLESPGPASAGSNAGSGLISIDNDDQTAANCYNGMVEAGLDRNISVNWNIVPWYLTEVRRPRPPEMLAARPYLRRLLGLLPDLRVVVLLGTAAQQGWETGFGRTSTISVLSAPHPSPMSINRSRERRPAFVSALRDAAAIAR